MNNFGIEISDSLSSINDRQDNQIKEDVEFENLFQNLNLYLDENVDLVSVDDIGENNYNDQSNELVDSIELIRETYFRQKNQNLQKQEKKQQIHQQIEADLNRLCNDTASFGEIQQQKKEKVQKQFKCICEYCKKEFQLLELEKHQEICDEKLEIEYQEINCPYCGDQIIRAFIKDHFEECIAYIEDNFKKIDNITECSICMSEMQFKEIKLKCEHEFHKDCINEWLKKKQECPVCRMKVQM